MASNYKDNYIRSNPRKNIECNPLYTDSNRPFIEHFENSDFKISGGNYEDNFSYLGENNKIQMACKKNNAKKKIIDFNLNDLLEKKNNGTVENIDNIHNIKIIKSMNYDKSNLLATQKMEKRLKNIINEKVINSYGFKSLDNSFFNHPDSIKYEWKNSYFEESKNTNGRWWNIEDDKVKPLDLKTVIDYRSKKPAKVNFDIIDYKN